MPNRIIYNAQDVFFGLPSGVNNIPLVTGTLSDGNTGTFEVLKRIHRVQSFNYDIVTNREDVGLIGRSSFDSHTLSSPPDVNGTVSYFLEGLTNEKKIGFNVLSSGASSLVDKEFTHSFVSGNKKQNIYLAVNKSGEDVRTTPAFNSSEITGLIKSGRALEITSSGVDDLGLLIFQNAYVNSYSLDITVGNYPRVDVGFVADNVIFLGSGTGIKTPLISSQDAEVEHGEKEIIIPKNYGRSNSSFDVNHTFRPSDVTIAVSKRAADEDILVQNDMESSTDFTEFHGATVSLTSSEKYQGLQSLQVNQASSIHANGNYGGAYIPVPIQQMVVGEYYTYEFFVKANTTKAEGELLQISQDGIPDTFNLSQFVTNAWTKIQIRKKLTSAPSSSNKVFNVYFPSASSLIFYVDSFKVYKDAENEPIQFYRDIFQSVKMSVPMDRENLSCIGHKYHVDRSLRLPLKTTVTIDMIESGSNYQASGNFLNNLRRDEKYDMTLTFMDGSGNQGMKFNIFGSKFEGAAYNSDIGSNKTLSTTFTLSNDYDLTRSTISAEGQGLFILDHGVDNNLNNIAVDNDLFLF